MILIERLQKYQLYHQAKLIKHEYLTGEEILPSQQQQQIMEQAKFTYSPLGKAFEKKNKSNCRSRRKTSQCFKIFRIF